MEFSDVIRGLQIITMNTSSLCKECLKYCSEQPGSRDLRLIQASCGPYSVSLFSFFGIIHEFNVRRKQYVEWQTYDALDTLVWILRFPVVAALYDRQIVFSPVVCSCRRGNGQASLRPLNTIFRTSLGISIAKMLNMLDLISDQDS